MFQKTLPVGRMAGGPVQESSTRVLRRRVEEMAGDGGKTPYIRSGYTPNCCPDQFTAAYVNSPEEVISSLITNLFNRLLSGDRPTNERNSSRVLSEGVISATEPIRKSASTPSF